MKALRLTRALALALWSVAARAASLPTTGPAGGPGSISPGDTPYVSRAEYEKLKREQDEMRGELDALRREQAVRRSTTATATPPSAAATSDSTESPARRQDLDAVSQSVQELKEDIAHYHSVDSRFTLVGDASFGYAASKHSMSSFTAQISPLVLWQPAPRILVEAAADIGLNTDSTGVSTTSFDLSIGNVSYLVNDYLAVGAGLFVVPFGQYHNHFDPPWINKLPDDPLPFSDSGIAPGSEVGAFVKGAVPVIVDGYCSKFTYDAYLTNGPSLITTDPQAAGSLNFDDFTDSNNNKAVGARFGFLPTSNLEIGYSVQVSEPSPAGFQRSHALLQAADFNWRQDVDALSGRLDLQGEYVWSDVSRATFDPDRTLGFGPLNFTNRREGGYLLAAFRPVYFENDFIRRLEFVARYDFQNTPLASPGGEHEQRLALGVDYWVSPQAVLKFAYEFDHRKVAPSQSALLIQFGLRL